MDWKSLSLFARNGLFLKDFKSHSENTLADITEYPFQIRKATDGDLDALLILEDNWDASMRSSKQDLAKRISKDPDGQFVAVLKSDSSVVGAIYTQRVLHIDHVDGVNFNTRELIHRSDGPVLMLDAVVAHPQVKHLQLGYFLRDFQLQRALSCSDITDIIAMTRCSAAPENLSFT